MAEIEQVQLPDEYKSDVQTAIHILTEAGCAQVFLFGALARGEVREGTDIDLAVQGCPRGSFFPLYGRLLLELEHPVDLVSLDVQEPFSQHLQEEGGLIQIA